MNAFGQRHCPACGAAVFNRRFPNCESCGEALPAEFAYTKAELDALDEDAEKNRLERERLRQRRRRDRDGSVADGDVGGASDAGGADAGD